MTDDDTDDRPACLPCTGACNLGRIGPWCWNCGRESSGGLVCLCYGARKAPKESR